MDEYESLSHSKWECKYRVVFIPKYRRKVLYGNLRKHLGEVFRKLAEQKKPTDDGSGKVAPPPVVKKQRVVKPADLVKATYLETSADVNGFLDALRRELEKAIANNERIQIR